MNIENQVQIQCAAFFFFLLLFCQMEQTFLICLENKLALSELPETLGGM